MKIVTSEFIKSYSDVKQMEASTLHEFAFIGRSNVGKSSLINFLCNKKELAKTSSKPGKTQLINQFLINKTWNLIDLPGYGYAKVSKDDRSKFSKLITNYISKRETLSCLMILIDASIPPQTIDLEFINACGNAEVPIFIIFTKTDKEKSNKIASHIEQFKEKMLDSWDSLPEFTTVSVVNKEGGDAILDYIQSVMEV